MRTNKIFLMAVMLLMSVCTFAQDNNTPLVGDVNGDGKVDVADIVAILKIMKDAGGTSEEPTYYWYAGQTQPISMNGTPTVDDINFTNNKWHTIGTTLTNINKTSTGGTSGNPWYVAVPKDKYKPTASDFVTPNTSWEIINTINVGSIQYSVYNTNTETARCAAILAVK